LEDDPSGANLLLVLGKVGMLPKWWFHIFFFKRSTQNPGEMIQFDLRKIFQMGWDRKNQKNQVTRDLFHFSCLNSGQKIQVFNI